ncbi:MAG: TolC family protein [Ferruginibacter sp.]|nr:TolC family protein [Ferruginibacter sp.]
MKQIVALLFSLFAFQCIANAQEKWNLKSVVEYAMANNIRVKQSEVDALRTKLNYDQSRAALIPNLSLGTGVSYNSGNNQDPITFNRITQSYVGANVQLQSSTEIFNFFSKRNTILANEWEWMASKANVDKLKYDIALTAANGFLQVLLAMEQEKIAEVQVKQTAAQLSNTRKMVDVGTLPELNATQLEAQLSLDSVNLVSAKGNTVQAVLLLKSYMNIDAAAPFEVDAPPVELIPIEPIAALEPEYVYQTALLNQPLQKANAFRLKAARKWEAASKGAMLPTLGAFGNLASAYNNQILEISGSTPVFAPIGVVEVGGVNYSVLPVQPFQQYSYVKPGFTNQLSNNFRQSIGLSLSVPLFNGSNLRTAWRRNKLNVKTLELQQTLDDQTLKQDIYTAHNNAVVALQRYEASRKNVAANEQAFEFANKRLEVGMLNTFEWITIQNNLLSARLNYAISQYDYVFKMKVLEFYKGQGLKL